MKLERMDNDKVYPNLITVMILFGEQYIESHTNVTPNKAIRKVAHVSTESTIVLDPLNAINLAKDLIDAAYYDKSKRKEKRNTKTTPRNPDRV